MNFNLNLILFHSIWSTLYIIKIQNLLKFFNEFNLEIVETNWLKHKVYERICTLCKTMKMDIQVRLYFWWIKVLIVNIEAGARKAQIWTIIFGVLSFDIGLAGLKISYGWLEGNPLGNRKIRILLKYNILIFGIFTFFKNININKAGKKFILN